MSHKFRYQSPRDAASYPTRTEAYDVRPHICNSQSTALRSFSVHVMHLLFFLVPLLIESVSVLQFCPVQLTPKVFGALPFAPSKITTTFPHQSGYSVHITIFYNNCCSHGIMLHLFVHSVFVKIVFLHRPLHRA